MKTTNAELRRAFVSGTGFGYLGHPRYVTSEMEAEAKRRYPNPTITRQRIIKNGEWDYRVENGKLQWRSRNGIWHGGWGLTLADAEKLVELLRNPTETVEVEE